MCLCSFPNFAMSIELFKDITNYKSCKKKPTLTCTMFFSPQGYFDIMYKVETGFLIPLKRITDDPIPVGYRTTVANPFRNILEIFCHFSKKALHNKFTSLLIGELLFLSKRFVKISNFSLEICLKIKMFPPCQEYVVNYIIILCHCVFSNL